MVKPVVFFWSAHAIALLVVAREWIAYWRAASHVRAVARAEGGDWPFTRDPKYQALFVYSPQSLLESGDTPALREAKLSLLRLRARMWRVVILAMAISASGVFLAVAWTIVSGIIEGQMTS
jgi:hypothetical protein